MHRAQPGAAVDGLGRPGGAQQPSLGLRQSGSLTSPPLCAQNPTLTAAYATAQVRGLQGEQPQGKWAYFNASKMVSLGKHYAAYGAALGGLNGAPAELSERTLREWCVVAHL